jgi:hypothetical protein
MTDRRSEPDLAEELELRDELLIACREELLGVGTSRASALVAHIIASPTKNRSGAPPSVSPNTVSS